MLPVQLTRFVGRGQELAAVRRLLATSRLLTLTGAGGSGKTRLALAAVTADTVESHARDIAWVELAAVATPDALHAHLATTLGIRTDGGVTAERAILATLRDRALLLVLDNCEHLVAACAQLVERLLQHCPQVRVLATSREALGIAGERSWLVPPLALPEVTASSATDALTSESVQLFVERAQDVLPSFALTEGNVRAVVQICRRLDGLPFAIELAAARVSVLAPQQIADRLDDRFALLTSTSRTALPRQRTLRAAVDWSYDLLTDPERLLLERLSVFAGGFTLDMAEQVCADERLATHEVLELLASLTTRSLVAMQESQGRARYRLLETIREYATSKRQANGDDDAIHRRHAEYCRAMVQSVEEELILGRTHVMQLLDMEHDNIRVALAWSAAHGEGATVGLPLCWATLWYWFHRQLWREGFQQIDTALASAVNPTEPVYASAMHGLGILGLYIGHPDCRERLTTADAIWRKTGNLRWLTFTLLVRTVEASLRKAPDEARAFADATIQAARQVPDSWYEALAIAHALVPVLLWEGQYAEAAEQLAVAERVYRERDYAIGVSYVLDARAFAAVQCGDLRGAVALACASLADAPQTENRWLAGRSLRILAAVAMQQGDDARAARLYGAADAMYDAIDARSLTAERRAVNEGPLTLQTRMAHDAFVSAWNAGRACSLSDAVAYALEADAAAIPAATVVALPQLSVTAELAVPVLRQVSVSVLGDLEIRVDGVVLPADAWRYARPRELLLYLLLHPDGRTREQIGLEFWPEHSAAQIKNNFHVTLHHLRKAMGRGEIIRFERDRYRVAYDEGVTVDALRFEQLVVGALRRTAKAPADAEALRDLSAAVAMYRGPLLETESVGDWHLELRDRLSRLYAQALHALGAAYEASGDHAAAAAVYGTALQTDGLDEEVVRRLMATLARVGRRADALRRYERFCEELERELEAEPARDTTRLAETIRTGVTV